MSESTRAAVDKKAARLARASGLAASCHQCHSPILPRTEVIIGDENGVRVFCKECGFAVLAAWDVARPAKRARG
jgi:RNase P subunit RPR2